MTRLPLLAATAFATLCAASPALAADRNPSAFAARNCQLSISDQAWVNKSIAAWRLTARTITGARLAAPVTTILFSGDCVLTSDTALIRDGPVRWTSTPHRGLRGIGGARDRVAVRSGRERG